MVKKKLKLPKLMVAIEKEMLRLNLGDGPEKVAFLKSKVLRRNLIAVVFVSIRNKCKGENKNQHKDGEVSPENP